MLGLHTVHVLGAAEARKRRGEQPAAWTHSVCMSVARPARPTNRWSCTLKTLGMSQAFVWFCTPNRRSLAMATHPSPVMAMMLAPL